MKAGVKACSALPTHLVRTMLGYTQRSVKAISECGISNLAVHDNGVNLAAHQRGSALYVGTYWEIAREIAKKIPLASCIVLAAWSLCFSNKAWEIVMAFAEPVTKIIVVVIVLRGIYGKYRLLTTLPVVYGLRDS